MPIKPTEIIWDIIFCKFEDRKVTFDIKYRKNDVSKRVKNNPPKDTKA